MNNLAHSSEQSASSAARRRAHFNFLIVLFLFLCSALIAQAAPGDLDPSFDGDGKLISHANNKSGATAVLVQPDGKIVTTGSLSAPADSFLVQRFNSDGSLDATFGSGGRATANFSGNEASANGGTLQADGKILVSGIAFTESFSFGFGIMRFNTDGTLDTTFGTGGRVTVEFFNDSFGGNIVALPNGKIVVAGFTSRRSNGGMDDFAIARLNSDGSLDTTFDEDGRVTTDFLNNDDLLYSLAVQPDGKIVAGGYTFNGTRYNFALARYNLNGSLDNTFGTNGKAISPPLGTGGSDEAIATIIQPDGSIIVGGTTTGGSAIGGEDFLVARYQSNGALDTTFGNGGRIVTDFLGSSDRLRNLALQTNGKLVAIGNARNNSDGNVDFALARYNTDGSLDTTFKSAGKLTTDFGNTDEAFAVALQPDGKIIAAGHSGNDTALARYFGDPSDVLISEFRFSGPNGSRDEFIELYNNTNANLTVSSNDNSSGWALASRGAQIIAIVPNGTIIPARGHYLIVNSAGYSLGSYGGGLGFADGDLTYTQDIDINGGIALFKTATAANFNTQTRLDAVGTDLNGDFGYKEGNGIVAPTAFSMQYSFVRDLSGVTPKDTGDNRSDFLLVSTNDTVSQPNVLLGAPAPENRFSPINRDNTINASLIDPTMPRLAGQNLVRNGSGNSGTLSIRRNFVNNTGAPVTRLRFRVINLTTLNSLNSCGGCQQADLRLTDSTDVQITNGNGQPLTIKGTTLEQPPTQSLGGGYNSSLLVALPDNVLNAGDSINVQFLLNVVQNGRFVFYVSVEALP